MNRLFINIYFFLWTFQVFLQLNAWPLIQRVLLKRVIWILDLSTNKISTLLSPPPNSNKSTVSHFGLQNYGHSMHSHVVTFLFGSCKIYNPLLDNFVNNYFLSFFSVNMWRSAKHQSAHSLQYYWTNGRPNL